MSALYLTRPVQPEMMDSDFERTLSPILSQSDNYELLQPGRLLVGDYRVVARKGGPEDSGLELTPGLAQETAAAAIRLLNQDTPLQMPVRGNMVAGPFPMGSAHLVISRPLTVDELAELENQDLQDWLPNIMWMAVAISGFGALVLGVWFVMPLKRLRTATREIAAGSAEPNLGRLPRRRDELGELARTLGSTAIELATSRDAQRRLLSDVSHELRSPLARLQVALDLLETEDVKNSTHWQQLEKDIFRLAGIIDSILWLSRLENGISQLEREPVSLGHLLNDLRGDLIYEHPEYKGRLLLPEEDLPTLETDPILLRLAIENLVRNGFQYGPEEGKVFITADITGTQCCLKILDEGPGVDESKLGELFVPFFRADPSRHHGAGVGLGLALCQRASTVLGGDIEARNHPEGGFEATFCLPLNVTKKK
ncbi:sensor histidine kinase [Aliidiomarina minuta]|nr:HAMP domain-containing sensor histidine kinase [Aliidiomarina minuta]